MSAHRLLPSQEASDFISLTRLIAERELVPRAAAAEAEAAFPRKVVRLLGEAGILGLPQSEEIASAWSSVGVGASVDVLSCFGPAMAGTPSQQEAFLPAMVGDHLLGAYCLSEPDTGSDPAAMRTRASHEGDGYVIRGAKATVAAR